MGEPITWLSVMGSESTFLACFWCIFPCHCLQIKCQQSNAYSYIHITKNCKRNATWFGCMIDDSNSCTAPFCCLTDSKESNISTKSIICLYWDAVSQQNELKKLHAASQKESLLLDASSVTCLPFVQYCQDPHTRLANLFTVVKIWTNKHWADVAGISTSR